MKEEIRSKDKEDSVSTRDRYYVEGSLADLPSDVFRAIYLRNLEVKRVVAKELTAMGLSKNSIRQILDFDAADK